MPWYIIEPEECKNIYKMIHYRIRRILYIYIYIYIYIYTMTHYRTRNIYIYIYIYTQWYIIEPEECKKYIYSDTL